MGQVLLPQSLPVYEAATQSFSPASFALVDRYISIICSICKKTARRLVCRMRAFRTVVFVLTLIFGVLVSIRNQTIGNNFGNGGKVKYLRDTDKTVNKFSNKLGNIPKVIHQTWKTKHLPKWAKLPVKSWKRLNPDFEYKFYSDDDMKRYVEKYYPKILKYYNNNMKPVQRSDIFRYIVIYAEGGIYADIDTTCAVPIHNWLTYTENFTKAAPRLPVANNVYKLDLNSAVNFIVGFEAIQKKPGWEKFFAAEFQLCQWTFGASKKHWLLKRVLDRIFDYYETGKHLQSASIIKSTGPGIWSYAIVDAFKDKYNVTFGEEPFRHDVLGHNGAKIGDDILVLPTSSFGRPFGGIGSSDKVLIWHGFQGSWKNVPYRSIHHGDVKKSSGNALYDAALNGKD